MGIKSSKNKKKGDKKAKEDDKKANEEPKKKEKKDINKNNKNKIIDLNSIQKLEPKFNNDYMLINDYKNNYFLASYDYSKLYLLSCYEIFQLKNENESFFIAYQNENHRLEIIEFNFISKAINKINFPSLGNGAVQKIKYFYNEKENKEYLFVLGYIGLTILLITNKNQFDKIIEYSEKGTNYTKNEIFESKLKTNEFEVIYNIYNQITYIIISFLCVRAPNIIRTIKIFSFEQDKINFINDYYYTENLSNAKILFLVWENKISKTYHLIINSNGRLKILEIGDKQNEIHPYDYFDEYNKNFGEIGCIINTDDNDDYLLLIDHYNQFNEIDLNDGTRRYYFNIDEIKGEITSIINWNNKEFILSTKSEIYIYDFQEKKILSKYIAPLNPELKENLISVKRFKLKDSDKSIIFFDSSDNTIRLLY